VLPSPPCQPFCKIGKRMDIEDPRARSLLHLLELIKVLHDPPDSIFLENVEGFNNSKAQQYLVEVLVNRGYEVEQYLLSPVQLGVPNTRLRYYLTASRRDGRGEGGRETCEGSSGMEQRDEGRG
ncbi:unnamed protein product, partial [Choristocarpus tenellus]